TPMIVLDNAKFNVARNLSVSSPLSARYSSQITRMPGISHRYMASSAGLPADHEVWKLGRLNHVAVAVPDLKKATDFYKNMLGAHDVSDAVVDDIKEAVKDLTLKEIRILDPEPKIGAHGNPVVFLHPRDCGGVLVELEEVK
ncbi:13518_t:CDS:2, partial [Acaulospora colombiana]